MSYDPDPRRRRHRSGRRGRVPPQLRAWVFRRRRGRGGRYDPGYVRRRKPWHRGPRGGKYWRGPTRRRYDPGRIRRYGRRAGGKLAGFFNKNGTWVGALLAGIAGFWQGYAKVGGNLSDYWAITAGGTTSRGEVRKPEISSLWGSDPIGFLKGKLGLDPNLPWGSWATGFWLSLVGLILSKLPIPMPGWTRVKSPLGKLATGGLVVSTIGVLALPGSPDQTTSLTTFPSTSTRELAFYR